MKLLLWLFTLLLVTWVNTVGAVDARYVLLGPGDVLTVSVYDNPDLTTDAMVSESGNITFPLLGEVSVDGLAPSAAEKKIADLLESGGFLRKPQVSILATSLQSQQVSVLGYVQQQGRYPIEGKRSLTDVLAMAGGVNPEGGDLVTLIRADGIESIKEVIDMFVMTRSSDMSQNMNIRGGDLIYVERAPRFYIYGEVQRPGVFRLERNMTVVQALSVGGGLTTRGTERGVRIQRRDAEGNLQILKVKPDELVQPDDVVYIRESLF